MHKEPKMHSQKGIYSETSICDEGDVCLVDIFICLSLTYLI